jgi:hypothetical protein
MLCQNRDAPRRVHSDVSYGVPSLVFALFGIFCRHRVAGIVLYGIPIIVSHDSISWVGVATIRIATLDVGLPLSCRMTYRRSSTLYSQYCVGVRTTGVAKHGVGLLASCCIASRGSSSLESESCVGVETIGVGTFDVGWSASCRMASQRSSSLYLETCVRVGKPASYVMFRDFA